jgi:hypothetical protein
MFEAAKAGEALVTKAAAAVAVYDPAALTAFVEATLRGYDAAGGAVPPALEAAWTDAAELLGLPAYGLRLSTKADALTAWMQLALMRANWLIATDEHAELGNSLVRIVARLFETKIADDVRVYPHVAHVAACIKRAGNMAFELSSFSAVTKAAAVAAVDYMLGDEGTVAAAHEILELSWPAHVREVAIHRAIYHCACWYDNDLKAGAQGC